MQSADCRISLLDAAHIAEGAIREDYRHQRNTVAHGGGELVTGVEKAAVAVDREYRHVGPRVLRAERGGVAPAQLVLALLHFVAARGAARIMFRERVEQVPQDRRGVTDQRHFRLAITGRLFAVGVDADNGNSWIDSPPRPRINFSA